MSASRRTLSEHREPKGSHAPSSGDAEAATARVWLYILECAGGRLYTGVASDPDRRFIEHQSGRGARFTRAYPPKRIAHREAFASRADAQARERQIKGWTRRKRKGSLAGDPEPARAHANTIEATYGDAAARTIERW